MNQYGNTPIAVGVGWDEKGVHLFVRDENGQPRRVLILEPEFAREVAQNFTLCSFECEDARRKSSGG